MNVLIIPVLPLPPPSLLEKFCASNAQTVKTFRGIMQSGNRPLIIPPGPLDISVDVVRRSYRIPQLAELIFDRKPTLRAAFPLKKLAFGRPCMCASN